MFICPVGIIICQADARGKDCEEDRDETGYADLWEAVQDHIIFSHLQNLAWGDRSIAGLWAPTSIKMYLTMRYSSVQGFVVEGKGAGEVSEGDPTAQTIRSRLWHHMSPSRSNSDHSGP